MSIYTDHNVKLVGNEVHFLAGAGNSQTLLPGDFYDVIADVVGGPISVEVESLDFHTPSFVRVVGGRADPDVQTWFNCVAISAQLHRGEEEEPVQTIRTPGGEKREGIDETDTRLVVDAGPIALAHAPTRWRLRVTNTSRPEQTVLAVSGMQFVRDRGFIGEERVPLRVLNHAFGVVINALAPHARLRGRTLHFGFGEEVVQVLGLQGDHPLREQAVVLDDIPDFIEAEGELESLKAEIVSGAEVRAAVFERWKVLDDKLAAAGNLSVIRLMREMNDRWRAAWEAKIEPDLVAVHIQAASEIDLSERGIIPGFEVDLGTIEDISVHLYLAFEREVGLQSGHVLVLASADYEGLVKTAESVGIAPGVAEFERKLATGIEEHIGLLHRYFAEVLVRIAPFLGDIPPIFIDARADETSVLVRYTSDPADLRATIPTSPQGQPVGRLSEHIGHMGDTQPSGGGHGTVAEQPSEPVDHGPLGTVPAGFELGDPLSVARLDKIETIVVVMMENRSFDHMLGFLRTVRGPAYAGFPDGASNRYIKHGFGHTVEMQPITKVLRADDVTQITVDPHHSFNRVKAQIAEGAMSGFAADLLDRGDPQFALTYYTDQQIPNYYRLAAAHMVCDQWYCAHPGPTYPNRWATLTGTIPQVENFDVDDPRLGFMRDATIFDTLTSAGIDWNYYENNVSMIRMYQRYRLDDTNVLPYSDPDHPNEGFKAKAAAGTLPPVVFVEPRFTGVPPLEQASDDHPPADLVVGQQFITDVYNALAQSPQWKSTLLVITYDEHGGFFDHVPPPGTQLGPPEWLNKVPRIHAEGADYMGPRVPTFVISPFVNPGSVSHAVFDHTSIIKTILVRHRQQFLARQFGAFGPRVMMINHLGAALDRDEARPGQPELLPAPPLRQRPERRATSPSGGGPRRRPTAPPVGEERTDFHVSLAHAMLPKRF
jgi:phospholipase C